MTTTPPAIREGRSGSLDWSQLYWPGPRRVFTAQELARGGDQPWLRGLDAYVMFALLLNLVPVYQLIPERRIALTVFLLGVALAGFGLWIGRWLWARPSRTRYNLANIASSVVFIVAMVGVQRSQLISRVAMLTPLLMLSCVLLVAMLGWWAVVMLRSQQIAARLTELDEQDRNLRLARQLATAQIQPHFLFNTLASVQHWVDTQDPRAAPTLRAFTQYLRSTLPMFERETLALAEELQIVRNYLVVMQARLGDRLSWSIDAEPVLGDLLLPPGTLLTLVENAIAHGIEPALRGGRITVSAVLENGQSILEVSDDGAGLCAEAPEGVGLGNTRARLQHQYGDRARLSLHSTNPGCRARIEIPAHP